MVAKYKGFTVLKKRLVVGVKSSWHSVILKKRLVGVASSWINALPSDVYCYRLLYIHVLHLDLYFHIVLVLILIKSFYSTSDGYLCVMHEDELMVISVLCMKMSWWLSLCYAWRWVDGYFCVMHEDELMVISVLCMKMSWWLSLCYAWGWVDGYLCVMHEDEISDWVWGAVLYTLSSKIHLASQGFHSVCS